MKIADGCIHDTLRFLLNVGNEKPKTATTMMIMMMRREVSVHAGKFWRRAVRSMSASTVRGEGIMSFSFSQYSSRVRS